MAQKLVVYLTPGQLSALLEAVGFRQASEMQELRHQEIAALENAAEALRLAQPQVKKS